MLALEVYPRVGGGNDGGGFQGGLKNGLSPRGRGKHRRCACQRTSQGSIPAWAGETVVAAGFPRPEQVYPRVGGGNGDRVGVEVAVGGLSPRGRGKPAPPASTTARCGSIPAWAGETRGYQRLNLASGVYPRVGGGNAIMAIISSSF